MFVKVVEIMFYSILAQWRGVRELPMSPARMIGSDFILGLQG